jgi:hypothetical protein
MRLAENIQANWQEGYCFIMTMPETARETQERIQKLEPELLEIPPYSPNLALMISICLVR